MKKLIHRYIDREYYVCRGKLYTRDFDHEIILSTRLSDRLSGVFDLNRNQLKWYIKSWAKKNRLQFSPFWKRRMSWMDGNLIHVQPLGPPTGTVFYMDYTISVDPVERPNSDSTSIMTWRTTDSLK